MKDYNEIKCKACGASVMPMKGNSRYYKCGYCGSVFTMATATETIKLERAYQLLRECDFDGAEELFDEIISRDPSCYEAYWGRLLARFGIVFVDDHIAECKVPTLHKMNVGGFLTDSDYLIALKSAPYEVGITYAEQGKAIERILKLQHGIAGKEKPYDVFICYKESDKASGIERTRDSYECSELYVYLTGLGYRVFYARETLRSYISQDYEPYIYNALSTAKVMIVYGTKPEYIKAKWVRNEWSRYNRLIASGAKQPNSLVLALSGMAPEQAPSSFASRQALNASARTFYTDLAAHISSVVAAGSCRCTMCGSELASSSAFCSRCGSKVASTPSVIAEQAMSEPSLSGTPIGGVGSTPSNVDPFAMSSNMHNVQPFPEKNKKINKFASFINDGGIMLVMAIMFIFVSGFYMFIGGFVAQSSTMMNVFGCVMISLHCIIVVICAIMSRVFYKKGKKLRYINAAIVISVVMMIAWSQCFTF